MFRNRKNCPIINVEILGYTYVLFIINVYKSKINLEVAYEN